MVDNIARTAPRSLSHDERKAAEAAFQGRPFNESWSASARLVYDGILEATRKLKSPLRQDPITELEPVSQETTDLVGALAPVEEGD